MEEHKVVEKRTTVTREDHVEHVKEPKTTNVNIGSDGSTQIHEETETVEVPIGSTIIRQEETFEKHGR